MWLKKENWKRLKKSLERQRNPNVYEVLNEEYLELGKDPIPQMTGVNFLRRIGSNPITYENTFPTKK